MEHQDVPSTGPEALLTHNGPVDDEVEEEEDREGSGGDVEANTGVVLIL